MRTRSFPMLPLVVLATTLLLGGCASAPPRGPVSGVEELASFMTGAFDSTEQAKADPAEYRDIRLHMVRIWEDRTDGAWLYVEQAVASSLAEPYRQRAYHVTALPDGTFRSEVFTIDGNPLRLAGAWHDPQKLAGFTHENLVPRGGCAITLRKQGDAYEGSTTGQECPSDLRGAAYATSIVTVTRDSLTSWDRGFDKDGKQVWGATKGPYRFRKS